jgi:hypothetical protein
MKNQKKKQAEPSPKPNPPASDATDAQTTAHVKTGRASFF